MLLYLVVAVVFQVFQRGREDFAGPLYGSESDIFGCFGQIAGVAWFHGPLAEADQFLICDADLEVLGEQTA